MAATNLNGPEAGAAGYLDDCVSSYLTGWAADPANPGRPAEVEFRLSTGQSATVRADGSRDEPGTAPGSAARIGFRVKLPPLAFGGPTIVSARLASTGEHLPGSPRHIRAPAIELLAGDIVDNCNLRCPFCLVDYSRIKGLRQMTLETYRKFLEVLPVVADGMGWLSCLHEPTLNAGLAEMIAETPEELRRKLSFTTNLCKRLDDSFLRAIADSAIHHFRVSYDTDQPELFARLRKGGNYTVFSGQLRRLRQFMGEASRPTRLAFVTMALRDNWRELPGLVRACAEAHQPLYHEVRYMYYQPHLAEWGKEHSLSLAEWRELEGELRALTLPGKLILGGPEPDAIERFERGERDKGYEASPVAIGGDYTEGPPPPPDPMSLGLSLPNEALELRLRWDGLLVRGETPLLNLNDLDDPVSYFRTVRSVVPSGPDDPWRP